MGFFRFIGNVLSAAGVLFGISDYHNHEGLFKNRPGSPEHKNEQKYDQGSYQGTYKEQRFRQNKRTDPQKREEKPDYSKDRPKEKSYEEWYKGKQERYRKLERGP
ncbi:hypothetical protein HY989_06160 [Candidatus Micrarchaeota archaeon]|nr:hypothetical protein [Candidatus Micrarchaeota archaeon]